MPIMIKDFSWRQTKDTVIVNVPLSGSSKMVDIYTSDNYIKVSNLPYLFEAFLFAPIIEEKSSCTRLEKEVIFKLHKISPENWEKLTADLSKSEMISKRQEIIANKHKKEEEEDNERRKKFEELKRLSVQQQIDHDSSVKREIEERKNSERDKAMKELEDWKKLKMKDKLKIDEKEKLSDVGDKNSFENSVGCHNEGNNSSTASYVNDVSKQKKEKGELKNLTEGPTISEELNDFFPIPLLRKPGKITINFTPREFPTPIRESQTPQEEEWLKKQMAARKATGFVSEDLRPEECNPTWLKDKGDSFYKVGNYLGAVSAYSHAIKLGYKMAALYSNRGAAHLALGNLHKALEDCSEALNLMTPKCDANKDARAKCHARRGAILCKLKLPQEGLADFEEALLLAPSDEKLPEDINQVKEMIRSKQYEE